MTATADATGWVLVSERALERCQATVEIHGSRAAAEAHRTEILQAATAGDRHLMGDLRVYALIEFRVPSPRISGDLIDRIARLHASGHTPPRIAAKLGVSGDVVRCYLRARGILPPSRLRQRMTDDQIAILCQVYRDGYGAKAAGEAIGVSMTSARLLLMEAGVVLRPMGTRRRCSVLMSTGAAL